MSIRSCFKLKKESFKQRLRFDGSAPKPFPPSRNGPTGKEWTPENGKILEGNFAVVDSAKPVLSIGKITKMGHTVSMTPEGGCIMLKDGKTKIPIYHRTGVWKVPVWVWYPDHFQVQGTTGHP